MSSCWPIKGEHIDPQYTCLLHLSHSHGDIESLVLMWPEIHAHLSRQYLPKQYWAHNDSHMTAPAPFCSVPHNAAIFNCCDSVMNCECFGFPFSLRTILGTGHNKFLREKKLTQKILELSSGLWPHKSTEEREASHHHPVFCCSNKAYPNVEGLLTSPTTSPFFYVNIVYAFCSVCPFIDWNGHSSLYLQWIYFGVFTISLPFTRIFNNCCHLLQK